MDAIADDVLGALERLRERSAFPKSPAVRRFEVREGEDSTDDPAVYVWVLLDDRTSDAEQTLENVRPIQEAVFDEVRKRVGDRWPYIRVVTERDYAEIADA